jgi:hypothetical protein
MTTNKYIEELDLYFKMENKFIPSKKGKKMKCLLIM